MGSNPILSSKGNGMDVKIAIIVILLIVFFWAITRPARKRRAGSKDERTERKTHNSRLVHYSGFKTSITEEGHRKVHAKKRMGAMDCSDECPYCAAGMAYQVETLKVFDDRPIRGRRQRRAVLRGEDEQ